MKSKIKIAQRIRQDLPATIFLCGMVLAIMTFGVSIFETNGQALVNLLHQNPQDHFMDFFNNLSFTSGAYVRGTSYPPLALLLNGLFAELVPSSLREAYSLQDNRYVIRDSQAGIMVYLLILLAIVAAFAFLFKKMVGGHFLKQEIALYCVLFSTPFIFSYERGNIIWFALVFAAGFVCGYDSENRWIRLLAYICLGVAAAIKIYPAVLGLLLVKERRWKDTALLAGIGMTVFLLPFLAFEGGVLGGIDGMRRGVDRVVTVMQNKTYGLKHDLTNFLGILTEVTGVNFERFAHIAVVTLLVCVIVTVVFRTTMPRWKAMALLSALMILVPGFSYTYTLTFMVIPLAFFLKETGNQKIIVMDCIYAVFFLGIFMPLVFPEVTVDMLGISEPYRLTPVTLMENIALIGMVGCILVQEVVNCIHEKIGRNPQ